MRHGGKITQWKDDQGYGFITPNGGGQPLFVHISSFKPRQSRPAGNESVTFELGKDLKGRLRAERVAFSGGSKPPGRQKFPLVLILIFSVTVCGLVLAGNWPLAVPAWYLAASLVAFVAYAMDKSAARRGGQRISEISLHFLALAGGWPGALLAQELLRHKFSKQSFRFVFWWTLLINLTALVWLMSAYGEIFLREMFGSQ